MYKLVNVFCLVNKLYIISWLCILIQIVEHKENVKMSITVRVSEQNVNLLNILKKDFDVNSYDKVLKRLTEEYLRKHYADTDKGFVSKGAVVEIEDRVVFIKDVNEDTVWFNDGSSIFNSSVACKRINVLANSVEEFEGEIK